MLTSAVSLSAVDQRTGFPKFKLRLPDAPYQVLYADGPLLVADLRGASAQNQSTLRDSTDRDRARSRQGPCSAPGVVWATIAGGGLRRITVPGV